MLINGWLQSAQKVESPHFNDRPDEKDISLLVIHNISLPPAKFSGNFVEDFFQGTLDCNQHPYFKQLKQLKVSSHFYIRRDGLLVQFVPLHKRAWHAGDSSFCSRSNCNDFSIGIELEGTDDIAYTDQQYVCLSELTRLLMQIYPQLTHDRILGHCDIAPQRKTDPGASFDWERFRDLLIAP